MSRERFRSMEEFAQASGISRPTLSKYFDDPASVRETTRHRIEAALKRFDYRPNLFARNLNRKQTRAIGIIVPHITDPFYAELVRQMELRCVAAGFWPIVISSHGAADLEARAVETLMSLKVAGALVAPLGSQTDAEALESLRGDIPMVFFDSRLDGSAPFVGTDNRQSMTLVAEYLCRTGEHPAFLEMPAVNGNAAERKAAYVEALERFGLAPILIGADETTWNFEELGFRTVQRLLQGPGLQTRCLLCANDRMAFGAMAAAYQHRLRVGRGSDSDLRIAGHDDHPLSRYACPPLTTAAQDTVAIAERSTELLLALLQDPTTHSGEELRLPARLVMRDSA
ncbi:LacI family DNA-binding transcriptional regulator [Mangrovicella endophytica]|uniref:LacI family DNA-binding transcriptional regulator n=1 Tax=Mangrovicella endophytica TaxID=2066697 RepID=UPI000C9E9144|nr:LacI family DNA-binding transcriptional regulator [Mangrovicella endophytica]